MSGIEVAGLILGIFPVALDLLEKCKKLAGSRWLVIAAEHKRCRSEIAFQQLVYEANLKRLLLPLAELDDTCIATLLRSPESGAWKNPEVTTVLKRRLAGSYELYLQYIGDFHQQLGAIQLELAFDPATKKPFERISSVVSLASTL